MTAVITGRRMPGYAMASRFSDPYAGARSRGMAKPDAYAGATRFLAGMSRHSPTVPSPSPYGCAPDQWRSPYGAASSHMATEKPVRRAQTVPDPAYVQVGTTGRPVASLRATFMSAAKAAGPAGHRLPAARRHWRAGELTPPCNGPAARGHRPQGAVASFVRLCNATTCLCMLPAIAFDD